MQKPLNLKLAGVLRGYFSTIFCFALLAGNLSAVNAQNLNLKTGQKFSYEQLDNFKSENNNGSSKDFSYRQVNYEVIGTELGRYLIKVTPARILSTTYNDRVLDSSLPFAEQENDEYAVVGKMLTTLSFTLVVDLRGNKVEVRDTAGMQALILAKLKERNTLNVKHHNMDMGDLSNQVPYLTGAILTSANVFKLAAQPISKNGLQIIPTGADNITVKKDPASGLTTSWIKDSTVNKTFTDPYQYDNFTDLRMVSLVNGNNLPLYDKAATMLNYADYYSPLNKAKRKMDDLIDNYLVERKPQALAKIIRGQIDSIDQYFKPDDYAYLGAKLPTLSMLGGDQYSELIPKIPYAFLPDDHAVTNKLWGELQDGNTANLKQAMQIMFTKMLSGKKYPNGIESLNTILHDTWTKQIIEANGPGDIKKVLDGIVDLEQLPIPAINELFAALKNYCQIKLTNDPQQLLKLTAAQNTSFYDMAARYRTLIYDELVKKKVSDSLLMAYNDQTIAIIKSKITLLNSGNIPGISRGQIFTGFFKPQSVIYKKYLADAYYRKSLLQKNGGITYLQMAADRMPNQQDEKEASAELEREYEILPKKLYTELYLKASEGGTLSTAQILKGYVDLVIIEPERYTTLKEKYIAANPNGDFKKFFGDALKEKLPAVPQFALNERSGLLVDNKVNQSKYVFIDFWGTWCGPCVNEIGIIDELYKNNPAPNKLVVTTIACADKKKNVDDFMNTRKYTYQVLMSDGKIEKDFGVASYPTKLLLLPNGTYLNIPSSDDYKPILEKYLKWEI